MPIEIRYGDKVVHPTEGETVLDAFERSGIIVPSSCRVGVCHFCLLKATDGVVPKMSQEGLDIRLKESGHFKTCVCYPDDSLTCEPAHSAPFRDFVKINAIEELGLDIVKVTFSRPTDFIFAPGQFATFRFEDGHARSYSLASLFNQEAETFDIHVRKIPNGKMSEWFHNQASPGEKIWMEGPKGECTYRSEFPEENLLLVGTGTGMAPLFAIAQDAMINQHKGSILIVQGALTEDRLYLRSEFMEMATDCDSVEYKACVLDGSDTEDMTVGDLRQIALEAAALHKSLRIYLCGDPGLVRHLKKHFFLAGTSLKNIHADPFIGTDTLS